MDPRGKPVWGVRIGVIKRPTWGITRELDRMCYQKDGNGGWGEDEGNVKIRTAKTEGPWRECEWEVGKEGKRARCQGGGSGAE